MKKAFKYIWDKNKYFIVGLCFVAVLLGVWELGVRLNHTPEYVLPAFSKVVKNACLLFGEKSFYKKLLATGERYFVALLLSCLFGVVFGIIGGLNGYFNACIKPIITVVKSVPVMAITLIILLNFGKDETPIVIGFMMGLPIIYAQVELGVKGIDKSVVEMARVYKIPFLKKLTGIYIPQIWAGFFSGLSTAVGMVLKAVISAEILCWTAPSVGLAMQIARSNMLYDTPILFAYVLIAIVLSLALEAVIKLAKKAVIKWK